MLIAVTNGTAAIFGCYARQLVRNKGGRMPSYFIIAILGCADGSAACTPVATVPTHYSSAAACSAATSEALIANSDLDFPSLSAECRAVVRGSASADQPKVIPAGAARS